MQVENLDAHTVADFFKFKSVMMIRTLCLQAFLCVSSFFELNKKTV